MRPKIRLQRLTGAMGQGFDASRSACAFHASRSAARSISLAAVASACPSALAKACFVTANSSRSVFSSGMMSGVSAGMPSGMMSTGMPTRAFRSFPCRFGQRLAAALRLILSGLIRKSFAASSYVMNLCPVSSAMQSPVISPMIERKLSWVIFFRKLVVSINPNQLFSWFPLPRLRVTLCEAGHPCMFHAKERSTCRMPR